jgi:hypothetical protein
MAGERTATWLGLVAGSEARSGAAPPPPKVDNIWARAPKCWHLARRAIRVRPAEGIARPRRASARWSWLGGGWRRQRSTRRAAEQAGSGSLRLRCLRRLELPTDDRRDPRAEQERQMSAADQLDVLEMCPAGLQAATDVEHGPRLTEAIAVPCYRRLCWSGTRSQGVCQPPPHDPLLTDGHRAGVSAARSCEIASPARVPRRHGSCLWRVIMSGARGGTGWLPVVLLAAFIVTVGSGAGWPAVGGSHAGGHAGGFGGGGHPGGGRPGGFDGGGHGGGSFSRGREFGGSRFGGRTFPHEHGGARVFVFPYSYYPDYGYGPYDPGYPYAAYCDPYSPYYAPQYCYWDGP